MTGARYQIAVDGQPRSNRDDRAIAIEAAEYLKYKNPHATWPYLEGGTLLRGHPAPEGFGDDVPVDQNFSCAPAA